MDRVTTTFAEGQLWRYKTRKGEESSRLIVLKVEEHPTFGSLVHITVDGLAVQSPGTLDGISNSIEHLPFAQAALAESVTELESGGNVIPPFEEGYGMWCEACEDGEGGV